MPPFWNGFVKSQLQKQGELTLAQLLNSIRIEDQHRPKTHQTRIPSVQANLIEQHQTNNNPKRRSKPKFQMNLQKQSNQSYHPKPNKFKPKGETKPTILDLASLPKV